MSIVDLHCHVFNADDVPVKGMLQARNAPAWVAGFLDKVLQGLTKDATKKRSASKIISDQEIVDTFKDVMDRDYPDYADSFQDYLDMKDSGETCEKKAVVRKLQLPHFQGYIEWLMLIVRDHRTIIRKLVKQFPDINLFVPLIVDMDHWLENDSANVSIADQVNILEKISREPEFSGKLHGFVPFDPYKQARFYKTNEGSAPLSIIKKAIENQGFIGVKVYPAMGYLPVENKKFLGMQYDEFDFDRAFDELFDYCQTNDVPITTHCSPGGAEAYKRSGFWGNPGFWTSVLEKYKKLRVNFAHFGGAQETINSFERSWAWNIVNLMKYENVYTDLGYFTPICNSENFSKYRGFFKTLVSKKPVAFDRVCYGSDWQMIVVEANQKKYYQKMKEVITDLCNFSSTPGKAFEGIMGKNALTFLGLDENGKNYHRLKAFYQDRDLPFWLS